MAILGVIRWLTELYKTKQSIYSKLCFAGWLAAELISDGISVWFDQWEMRIGDSLRQKVERGIETSAYLVIILSPTSVESEWISHELDAAFVKELEDKRVFLLPVLYQPCKIPLFLRGKLYADFTADKDQALKDLMASIDRSEVAGHGKTDNPTSFTDWTTDWKQGAESYSLEIVINQHSKIDDWSVICYLIGESNPNLTRRIKQYLDQGFEWYAIGFCLKVIANTVLSQVGTTDLIYIDGAHEAQTKIARRDDPRSMELTITTTARRLGKIAGADTVFEYGSIVNQIAGDYARRQTLVIPTAESEKLKRFLIENPP